MIVISGQELVGVNWILSSPEVALMRAILFSFPILVLSYFSLNFLRRVNSGTTIFLHPFHFVHGKSGLTRSMKKQGCIRRYYSPLVSALIGLFLFSAAEFLLIVIFKQPIYHFRPL